MSLIVPNKQINLAHSDIHLVFHHRQATDKGEAGVCIRLNVVAAVCLSDKPSSDQCTEDSV